MMTLRFVSPSLDVILMLNIDIYIYIYLYICYDVMMLFMLHGCLKQNMKKKNSALFFPGQYVLKNIVMEKFLETYFISNIEQFPQCYILYRKDCFIFASSCPRSSSLAKRRFDLCCDGLRSQFAPQKKGDIIRQQGYWTRTTDTQRELFFKNSKFFGLGRQIGPKIYEAFGLFLAKL